MTDKVIRLEPNFFIHVHDNNTNLSQLFVGPATLTIMSHQKQLTADPQKFVAIPPESYAIIENPVVRDADGDLVKDKHGQVKVAIGESQIRFSQPPFPLYPGEVLKSGPTKLTVLRPNQALLLKASRTFVEVADKANIERQAGDEWLFMGPGTYRPRIEVEIVEFRDAIVLKEKESLRLKAKNQFKDPTGVVRAVGEEYLWSRPGAYMVGVDELLINVVPAVILTREKALHVEVLRSFKDTRPWANVERSAGQAYLLTYAETTEFTPTPNERIASQVDLVKVSRKQHAVILDPVGDDGVPRMGQRKVVTNTCFFLKPCEKLEDGVKDNYVLAEDEALLLSALEEFMDDESSPAQKRLAGEMWLHHGPCEYIPNRAVRVIKPKGSPNPKRKKILLADNEGVYVRNTQTGEVRAVIGENFMPSAIEELWEKDLPPVVEEKLARQGASHAAYMDAEKGTMTRDRTRVVSFKIPHNSVTQVYDYKKRTQRTVFGPDLVLLGPDEQFTLLSLSGSQWDPKNPNKCLPKTPNQIKAIYLFLGPSNLSDVINVETADHARLALQLSYDWYFNVEPGNTAQADECFAVPDFVGDCCSCIASRVRAMVASVNFDKFHKGSSRIVQQAVFGVDPATNQIRSSLKFPNNRLVVTSVDIQEIEVLDDKTREALQRSVKMAIEITTQSQESSARQEASVREQQANGKLERQMLEDRAANEKERKTLLDYETRSAAIESTGQAKAEAKSRAQAAQIESTLNVDVAKISAGAKTIAQRQQIELSQKKKNLELSFKESTNDLEVHRTKALAQIEGQKFEKTMTAVGRDTVVALARAGPELQLRLLKSLGLQGFVITDGTKPINLFNTAQGLASAATGPR